MRTTKITPIKKNIKTPSVSPEKYPQFYSNNRYDAENTESVQKAVLQELDYANIKDEESSLDFDILTSSNVIHSVGMVTNTLPYCCGIIELGELSADKGAPSKELAEILDTIVINTKGKSFIVNTNGIGVSLVFEAALAKCKYFTLVKSFKNNGNGNIIKVWLSNNE